MPQVLLELEALHRLPDRLPSHQLEGIPLPQLHASHQEEHPHPDEAKRQLQGAEEEMRTRPNIAASLVRRQVLLRMAFRS